MRKTQIDHYPQEKKETKRRQTILLDELKPSPMQINEMYEGIFCFSPLSSAFSIPIIESN